MTSYTVTVTSDDDAGTTTTLRLDVAEGQVLLTDLHLKAGAGLSTGQVPPIDFGLLLQAINPTSATPISSGGGTTAQPSASTGESTPRTPSSRRGGARKQAQGTRGGRRAAASTEPGSGGRRGARRAAASAEPGSGGRRGRKATPRAATGAASGGGESGRAYRRMPDDLASVYTRIGSPTAVAAHYDVPRHTVQGWLRRLREQGALPAS